jgi:hypothetical protein
VNALAPIADVTAQLVALITETAPQEVRPS